MDRITRIIREEIKNFGLNEIIKYLNLESKEKPAPLKADDDHVYIFRATSTEAELENVLNGGQSGGKFWGSLGEYKGKYVFVSKDGGCHKTWASNTDFYDTLVASDSMGKAVIKNNKYVMVDNPNHRQPNKFTDHFQEVGCGKTLNNIDYVLKRVNDYSDEFEVLYPKQDSLTEIIREEVELFELRHINVPTPQNRWKFGDIDSETPLKDDEVIRVYHGFYSQDDALLTAKYGLSGKERASRVYSYEAGNNPKGLFVSVQFDTVKRDFAGSGVIMEFSTKVSDLEAPVWVGGRSYFVQGEYTKDFKDADEREQQRLINRKKYAASEFPAIANSDRPELAWALYEGPEKQALYTGDLNPNMIQAFWVNERLMKDRMTDGPWERLSRKEFIKKYYDEERFKSINQHSGGVQYNSKFEKKSNKIMKPADDFTDEFMRKYLQDNGYDYDDFIEYYIKRGDSYSLSDMFYPKQIAQIKKIYGI